MESRVAKVLQDHLVSPVSKEHQDPVDPKEREDHQELLVHLDLKVLKEKSEQMEDQEGLVPLDLQDHQVTEVPQVYQVLRDQ